MTKLMLIAIVGLALFLTISALFPFKDTSLDALYPKPPSQAAQGSIYWGAYAPNAPWTMSDLSTFEGVTGKGVSIVKWYQSWGVADSSRDFQTQNLSNIRSHGSIPFIAWEPWDYTQGVNQPAFTLKSITNGSHDVYITKWAQAAKAWGQPFFLSFGHEMNGNWNSWSEGVNGNLTGDFVPAWRHTYDIFKNIGANNATWVWCPNVDYFQSTALEGLYPGNNYVDWTCMHGYNWGNTKVGNVWQSFTSLFGPTYTHLLQIAPNKPIIIGETGSAESGGDKAAWLRDSFETQLPNNYPRIKGVIWFNINKETDWRINSSQTALNAFRAGIGLSYYLSNQFSTLATNPIPEPVSGTPGPNPTVTPIPSSNPGQNILQNPIFDSAGTSWFFPWFLNLQGTAQGAVFQDSNNPGQGSFSVRADITQSSTNDWHYQLAQGNVSFTTGTTYTITFLARAAVSRAISVLFAQNYSPYNLYTNQPFTITSSWQTYSFNFTPTVNESNSIFAINLGNQTGSVWIDNVRVSSGITTPAPTNIPTAVPTPTPVLLQGDADRDGDVDIFDYNIVMRDYGKTGTLQGDLDKDNDCDIFDYNMVLRDYGKTS